jgi:hypothetical protein
VGYFTKEDRDRRHTVQQATEDELADVAIRLYETIYNWAGSGVKRAYGQGKKSVEIEFIIGLIFLDRYTNEQVAALEEGLGKMLAESTECPSVTVDLHSQRAVFVLPD